MFFKTHTKGIFLLVTVIILSALFYSASASGLLKKYIGADVVQTLDIKLNDYLTQKPKIISPNIYVIGIDETTLRELGPWNTWNRGIMADLINKLNENPNARPAVIGVDVSYFNESDPEYDQKLVDAAKNGGNVVVAAESVFSDRLEYDQSGIPYMQYMVVDTIDYPYDALKAVTKQGIINTLTESDGVIRNSIHKVSNSHETLYSFAYTIYKEYAKKNNLSVQIEPPLDNLNRFHISFSGLPGDYYAGNSFVRVLDGTIPADLFANSIVLIGPYATGMQDQYYTPIDTSQLMYGVEIHANILQAIIDQNFKSTVPIWAQSIILALVILIASITFYYIEPKISAIILGLSIFAYLTIVVVLYKNGWILNPLYIPIILILLYIYKVINSYFSEKNRRQTVTNTFKRYMEPQVVEHLLKDGAAQLNMMGSKRHIAVLFVDIRGFTTMSESLETQEVVQILNDYLTLVSNAIFKNRGTLDKFIGDAAMAIFNAPLDLDDYVFRAVKTAVDIAQGSGALQERLQQQFGRTVSFGIGVNCGEAIVGNIGADFRMDYTAIGDTVNTAARLESNAKAGQILISSSVYELLKDRIVATEFAELTLKGKTNKVLTYLVEDILK